MIRTKLSMKITNGPLSWYDWFIFLVLAVLCYLSFLQGDILHTGGSSFAYLNGHILDFYDYNVQYVAGNAYMPSTYALFAVWNIPIKIMDLVQVPTENVSLFVALWYKLLPVGFYFLSAAVFYKICQALNMDSKKSLLCCYAFLTTPIAFFSQFIFGQYDSFTLFFTLLGILFYLRKDLVKFAIFTGVAITFKYTPFLLFVPLLMLAEKKIGQICKYLLICVIPIGLEVLVYLPSAAFRKGVFGFETAGSIFQMSLDTPYFSLSLFIVFWIVLAAAAYFKEPGTADEQNRWFIFYANVLAFLIFGLSFWHPQWLLFAVPFWVLGSFSNRKIDIFMIIDILLMAVFVIFTVNTWQDHVDQNLFAMGIFKHVIGSRINIQLNMRSIFSFHDRNMLYSIFSGLLLVNAIFKHPKFAMEQINESIDHYWHLIRIRFIGGLAIFLIPAFICFFVALSAPYPVYAITNADEPSGGIAAENSVTQVFTATSGSICRIDVMVGTYQRVNDSHLNIEIMEISANRVVKVISSEVNGFNDLEFNAIEFDTVPLVIGEQYAIRFYSTDATDANCIAIFHTLDDADIRGYAIVDNEKCAYDLCIKLYSAEAAR